eukprot:3065840-Amphidinium_carterae.2
MLSLSEGVVPYKAEQLGFVPALMLSFGSATPCSTPNEDGLATGVKTNVDLLHLGPRRHPKMIATNK